MDSQPLERLALKVAPAARLKQAHLKCFSRMNSANAVSCVLQDSWFNTLKLQLPPGAGYEIQMRYGR
jgi:hypothetical protein